MALSRGQRRLPDAQPSDLVFLGYVVLSGVLILLFGWSMPVGLWGFLIVSHLVMLAIGVWFAGKPTQANTWFGILRDA